MYPGLFTTPTFQIHALAGLARTSHSAVAHWTAPRGAEAVVPAGRPSLAAPVTTSSEHHSAPCKPGVIGEDFIKCPKIYKMK